MLTGDGVVEDIDRVSVDPAEPLGGENLPGRSRSHQLACVENRDPIGVGRSKTQIVQYDNHGTTGRGQ